MWTTVYLSPQLAELFLGLHIITTLAAAPHVYDFIYCGTLLKLSYAVLVQVLNNCYLYFTWFGLLYLTLA